MHQALAGLYLAAVYLALVHLELDDGEKAVNLILYHGHLCLSELKDVELDAFQLCQRLRVGLQFFLQFIYALLVGCYRLTLGQSDTELFYAVEQYLAAVVQEVGIGGVCRLAENVLQFGNGLVKFLQFRV